jgi:hypothetical protein
MRPGLLILTTLLACLPAPVLIAEGPEDVRVVNFPEVQAIRGFVEMKEPATNSRLVSMSESVVSPIDPANTASLSLVGTLDASGFRTVVLSLAGEIKSNYPTTGSVGALLVPDTPFVGKAFEESGETLLSLRLEAAISQGESFFAVTRPRVDLAFPRYRVYFFNTSEQPSTAVLYAFLAN